MEKGDDGHFLFFSCRTYTCQSSDVSQFILFFFPLLIKKERFLKYDRVAAISTSLLSRLSPFVMVAVRSKEERRHDKKSPAFLSSSPCSNSTWLLRFRQLLHVRHESRIKKRNKENRKNVVATVINNLLLFSVGALTCGRLKLSLGFVSSLIGLLDLQHLLQGPRNNRNSDSDSEYKP